MMGPVLVMAGALLGVLGMTSVIACASANQVELYRWITGRFSGAKAARSLLSAPSRIMGSARGMAAAGVLLAGIGARATLDGLGTTAFVVAVFSVVLPMAVAVLYVLPNAIGQRWSDSTIELAVPWVGRLAIVFAPALPHSSTVRPRADLARQATRLKENDQDYPDDLALVSGVLAFAERQVRDVLTPRTDVVAVQEGTPLADFTRAFVESGYSRLPVHAGSLDEIVGIHYAFDLLKLTSGEQLPVRPVTVVPLTKPCADLLFEMQRDRHQVAVVLDELGGTAGIVTLNDLLAELVEETFDTEGGGYPSGVGFSRLVEVAGAAPLAEVLQLFDISAPAGTAETVGGMLSGAVGRIPTQGEKFEVAGIEFDVLDATATKVERVIVRRAGVGALRIDLEKTE